MPSLASQPDPPVIGRAGHPEQPRRILAVQTQRIGDVLCFLPLLAALRQRFPAARLTALVEPPANQLLRGHPDLDQIYVHDPSVIRGRAHRIMALAAGLRRERFDWALVVHAARSVTLGNRGCPGAVAHVRLAIRALPATCLARTVHAGNYPMPPARREARGRVQPRRAAGAGHRATSGRNPPDYSSRGGDGRGGGAAARKDRRWVRRSARGGRDG